MMVDMNKYQIKSLILKHAFTLKSMIYLVVHPKDK